MLRAARICPQSTMKVVSRPSCINKIMVKLIGVVYNKKVNKSFFSLLYETILTKKLRSS